MFDWQQEVEILNALILSSAQSPWDAHYLVAKYGFRRDAFPIYYMGDLSSCRVAVFTYNPDVDLLVDDFESALINHELASNPEYAMMADLNGAVEELINDYYSIYFDEKRFTARLGSHLSEDYYKELRSRMIKKTLYKDILKVYHSPFSIFHLLPYRSPKLFTTIFSDAAIKDVLHHNWEITARNLLSAPNLKLIHFSGKDTFKKAITSTDPILFPPDIIEFLSSEGSKLVRGKVLIHDPDGQSDAKEFLFINTNQVSSRLRGSVMKDIHGLVDELGIVLTLF